MRNRGVLGILLLILCLSCNKPKIGVVINIELLDVSKLILGVHLKNQLNVNIHYQGSNSTYYNEQFSLEYRLKDEMYHIKANPQIIYGATLDIIELESKESVFLKINLLDNFDYTIIKNNPRGELKLVFKDGYVTGFKDDPKQNWSSNTLQLSN